MSNSFFEGFDFCCKNLPDALASQIQSLTTGDYLRNLEAAISDFSKEMNQYQGNMNPQLKGFVAEAWHTHTYNVNARANIHTSNATQHGSNSLGSVDVGTSEGAQYSLKYYKNGAKSALAQGHTLEWAYKRHVASLTSDAKVPTIQEYLEQQDIDPNTDIKLGLYQGQARLVPADQLQDAIDAIKARIARNEYNLDNPDRILENKALKDTLDFLTDRIESKDGTIQSVPLNEEQSRHLASCARDGKFDPSRYDFDLATKADRALLFKTTMESGASAAIVSAMIKAAPQIVKVIDAAIRTGRLDIESLKEGGKKAAEGGAEGFLRGIACATLVNMSNLGYFGEGIKAYSLSSNSALPSILAIGVTFVVETAKDAIKMHRGELDKKEFVRNIEKRVIIAAFAFKGGVLIQSLLPIPVFGYLLGSLLGSLLGGLAFSLKEFFFMTLCVNYGFTFFGLVDQNYQLPEEVLNQIGADILELDTYLFEPTSEDRFVYDRVAPESTSYDRINCIMIERTVTGVRCVGYTIKR